MKCRRLRSGMIYEDMTGDYDEAFAALRRLEARGASPKGDLRSAASPLDGKEKASSKTLLERSAPRAQRSLSEAIDDEDDECELPAAFFHYTLGFVISVILAAVLALFFHHGLGWI